jgi:hypothetical protein
MGEYRTGRRKRIETVRDTTSTTEKWIGSVVVSHCLRTRLMLYVAQEFRWMITKLDTDELIRGDQ